MGRVKELAKLYHEAKGHDALLANVAETAVSAMMDMEAAAARVAVAEAFVAEALTVASEAATPTGS
jgi:hypothetical protein